MLFVILVYVCFNYMILFFNEETIRKVALEDGLIEYLGASCFFTMSILCFALFILSRKGNDFILTRTNKNIFYLLLGIAFLFAAGEEISWGQRIFSISVPKAWATINVQKELTLHNLIFFQRNKQFHFFCLTNINTWFTAFSLGFCFFIPLLNKLFIKVSKRLQQIRLPIVPIEIGIFFLITYLIFIIIKFYFRDHVTIPHAASEIRESIWAFLYVIIAVSWIKIENKKLCRSPL